MTLIRKIIKLPAAALLLAAVALSGCENISSPGLGKIYSKPTVSPVEATVTDSNEIFQDAPDYVIGPLDQLSVFVWRAPELSTTVTVRPDGRMSTPLVDDMVAAGKTPAQLKNDIETELAQFVKSPKVTVDVLQFSSTFSQQIRVLGEAQRPEALPYQAGMTVLDVMVAVGGLTEFAAGNRAILIRGTGANRKTFKLKLGNLMRRADVTANVPVLPGDVILIPESIF